eukprot:1561365-Alexandrium_andersonii.AAC.1
MSASLVGSEMCIRDRCGGRACSRSSRTSSSPVDVWVSQRSRISVSYTHLTLPTDDMQCVDLGGRRIIKK